MRPRPRTATAIRRSSSRSTTSSSARWRLALQRVPAANAVWAGDRILRFKHSDIGIAVALDGGLITPVIRNAETKSLSAISAEMKDLADARPRQETQAGRIPGRIVGDLQSRHARRARVHRHHQSAARNDPRGRRRAPASGREGRRRHRLRQHDQRHAVVRPSRRSTARSARNCWPPSRL